MCISISGGARPGKLFTRFRAEKQLKEIVIYLTTSGFRFIHNILTKKYFKDMEYIMMQRCLTLTLPGPSAGASGSLDSYCSLKPLCSGMGEVVPARTSPTLLPPSPRTVLSLSYFKVLQCINCRDWHCKS